MNGQDANRAWVPALIALVITLVGTAIRLQQAVLQPVWRDEAQAVGIARQQFPAGIVDAARHDGNAPLFYLLEHFFVSPRDAQFRELRERTLPLIAGIVLIPVAGLAAQSIAGSVLAALVTMALVACSPVAIELSSQVRMYSIIGLAAASATLSLSRALRGNRWAWWSLYAASITLAILLHPLTAAWVFAFAVISAVDVVRRRHLLLPWIAVHGVSLILIAPTAIGVHERVGQLTNGSGQIPWALPPRASDVAAQAATLLTGIEVTRPIVIQLCAVVIGAMLLLAACYAAGTGRYVAVLIVAFAVSYGLALRSASFLTRYHSGDLSLSLILLGIGTDVVRRRVRLGFLVALIALGILLIAELTDRRYRSLRSSTEITARFLEGQAASRDVIVTIPDSIAVSLNYYLPMHYTQIDLPELDRVEIIDFAGWPQRFSDRSRWNAFAEIVARAGRDRRQLWVVLAPGVIRLPENRSAAELATTMLPAQAAMADFALSAIRRDYTAADSHAVASVYESMVVTRWIPKGRP